VLRNRAAGGGRADANDHLEYELARLPRDVTTAITWYMKENDVTRRELAARMSVTPGRVSQILSGDENLTLRTLAAVCVALDAHLQVDVVPNSAAGAVPDRSRAAVAPGPRAGYRAGSERIREETQALQPQAVNRPPLEWASQPPPYAR